MSAITDVNTRLYTREDLARLMRICVRQVDVLRGKKLIPAPVKLGGRGVRWLSTDIDRFLAGGADMDRFENLKREKKANG